MHPKVVLSTLQHSKGAVETQGSAERPRQNAIVEVSGTRRTTPGLREGTFSDSESYFRREAASRADSGNQIRKKMFSGSPDPPKNEYRMRGDDKLTKSTEVGKPQKYLPNRAQNPLQIVM